MINKILVAGCLTIGALASSLNINKDTNLQYYMKKNNQYIGMFLINKKKNNLTTKYYNLNSAYKVPFYDTNTKEYTYNIIDNKLILDKLKIGKIERSFKYDLSELSSDMIDYIGVTKVDISTRSVIFDKDTPDYTIDKQQIHSVESLLVSIMTDTFDYNSKFFLYEPQKKLLLDVKMIKQKNTTISINNKMIHTKEYLLQVTNGSKRLLKIYITKKGTPVRVASTKGRWSFDLVGVGNFQKIKIDIKDNLLNENMKKLNRNANLTLLNQNYISNSQEHIVQSDAILDIGRLSDEKFLEAFTSKALTTVYNSDTKKISVSLEQILDYIEKKISMKHKSGYLFEKKISDSIYYSTFVNYYKSYVDRNCKDNINEDGETILECAGKEKKEFSKEEINKVLKKHIDRKDIKDLEYSISYDKQVYSYSYKIQKQYSQSNIKDYAKEIILEKFNKYVNFLDSYLLSNENEFFILVSTEAIKENICKEKAKKIKAINSNYKNSQCYIKLENRYSFRNYNKKINRYILNKYKALKWMDKKINYLNPHTIEFNYIIGYSGVDDASL